MNKLSTVKIFIFLLIIIPFNILKTQNLNIECDSLYSHFDSLYSNRVSTVIYEIAPQIEISELYISNEECNNLIPDTLKIYIRAIIDVNGNVKCIRFLKSLDKTIEKCLINHIKKMKFKPGIQKGERIISDITFPLQVIHK